LRVLSVADASREKKLPQTISTSWGGCCTALALAVAPIQGVAELGGSGRIKTT
jgi:hypothetical protein